LLFVDDLVQNSDDGVVRREVFPGETIEFVYRPGPTTTEPATLSVRLPKNSPTATRYARHFAWYAAEKTPLVAAAASGEVNPPAGPSAAAGQ
ncbi:MAG: hypothetical protein AAF488_19245, partial [Planctomycetota bacterium]